MSDDRIRTHEVDALLLDRAAFTLEHVVNHQE